METSVFRHLSFALVLAMLASTLSIRAVTLLRATPAGRAKPRMTQVPGIPSEDIGK